MTILAGQWPSRIILLFDTLQIDRIIYDNTDPTLKGNGYTGVSGEEGPQAQRLWLSSAAPNKMVKTTGEDK